MPRLDAGSTSVSDGFSIPFKALAAVGLIACGIGYIVYQFERLHPAPSKPAVAKVNPETAKRAMFEKLNLSPDQVQKLATLEKDSTQPGNLRREAMKVLTPDQLEKLKQLREEAQNQIAEKKAARERKMQKYFGGDLKTAQNLQEQARARTQARREAAKNQGAQASSTSH